MLDYGSDFSIGSFLSSVFDWNKERPFVLLADGLSNKDP